MAAGKGTRMNDPMMAKVMYEINGKPLVQHVVELAERIHSSKIVVIVGWQKESVIRHLTGEGKRVTCVEQNPQLGTGHAVMQAEPILKDFSGDVLVLSGDVPRLLDHTLEGLLTHHHESDAVATVLTAELADPTGYGRIIRNESGDVLGIVEQKDATEDQKNIKEINSGIYVFQSEKLFSALKFIRPANAQKEYYLTDVFEQFWKKKLLVAATIAADPTEIQGINTPEQLEEARAAMSE
jgi:UDP-N-acetylglucosamine pyrophosphorylase